MGASIKICYVMLCYVMLCYVMLCYVMLCYVMLCYNRANRTDMSTINFSLDGSPSKDVACEAIDCLNSETLTLYLIGLEGDVLSFNSFQNILSRHG